MYSPRQFELSNEKAAQAVLKKLKQPLEQVYRRVYLRQIIRTSSYVSQLFESVSLLWKKEVLQQKLELVKLQDKVKLSMSLMKSRVNPGYRSNVEELHQVLDQLVDEYKKEEDADKEVLENLIQRASDSYGNLSIETLLKSLKQIVVLQKEISTQDARAKLTLDITEELIQQMLLCEHDQPSPVSSSQS